MSTFLELCQSVASHSGTVSGSGQPAAVTGQTGRLSEIVGWTAEAWTRIQNLENAWAWMRTEFSGTTTSGTARYTGASWSLTRFARWVTEQDMTTIYLQSTGVSDEGVINPISWSDWRIRYGRGSQINQKPVEFAVSPQMEFCLGPIPDDTYVVNGEYYKTAQTLAANADEPELPARFHDIIKWRALMFLHAYDEGSIGYIEAKDNFEGMLFDLRRDQLPRVSIGSGPLA